MGVNKEVCQPDSIPARVIVWRDIWYTIIWGGKGGAVDSNRLWMNWRLYSIQAFRVDDGAPLYESSKESPLNSPEIADATAVAEGFIKWDGCMQWSHPEGVQFHMDERQQIRHYAEALERIRDLMREEHGGDIEGR